jgi:hypothetical protein
MGDELQVLVSSFKDQVDASPEEKIWESGNLIFGVKTYHKSHKNNQFSKYINLLYVNNLPQASGRSVHSSQLI